MRRRGRESADSRDPLLARQGKLGRRDRIAQSARLRGDAPGIGANKHGRDDERGPDAEHELRRKFGRRPAPRQRHMPQSQRGDDCDGEDRQRDDGRPRQNRSRYGDRSQDQDRERVFEAAGQVQQESQLQQVVAEEECGLLLAEPGRGPVMRGEEQVQRGRAGDDPEGRQERQREIEDIVHDDERQRLAGHRDPADPDKAA